MLFAALRDLQFRARRFGITVAGTSLVFAVTLLLGGVSTSFAVEAEDTMALVPLDGWVVGAASAGPLLSVSPLPLETVERVRALPGVTDAGAMALGRQTVDVGGLQDVMLVAAEPGRPGMPVPAEGRAPEGPDEIVVSSRLGLDVGDTLLLGERERTVVGAVGDATLLAGVNLVFLTMDDARELLFAGAPVVTSVAYQGAPTALPDDLVTMGREDALAELARPVASARSSIGLVSVLLWLVAGIVLASVVYLSVLERESDFAVFKATGWATRSLLTGVAFQALLLALLSAAVGAVAGTLLAPRFPLRVEITTGAYVVLPLVAAGIGLLASLAGLRRIVKVDPAAAFG